MTHQGSPGQRQDTVVVVTTAVVATKPDQHKSTVVTTNRPFAEWHEVFPNAACVVSLVDRLMHNAEVVSIKGESYRAKEARDRAEQKAKQRRAAKSVPQAGGQP